MGNQFEVISDTFQEEKMDEEEKEIIEEKEKFYNSDSKIDVKKHLIKLKYFSKRNQIKELFSSVVEFYEKSISEEKDSEETDSEETDSEEKNKQIVRNLFKKKKKQVVQLRQ